jgi:hypothetical protein
MLSQCSPARQSHPDYSLAMTDAVRNQEEPLPTLRHRKGLHHLKGRRAGVRALRYGGLRILHPVFSHTPFLPSWSGTRREASSAEVAKFSFLRGSWHRDVTQVVRMQI